MAMYTFTAPPLTAAPARYANPPRIIDGRRPCLAVNQDARSTAVRRPDT
jgi:hypothetical protein